MEPVIEASSVAVTPFAGVNERRWWLALLILVIGVDCLLLLAASYAAYEIRFHSDLLPDVFVKEQAGTLRPHFYAVLSAFYIPLNIVLYACMGAFQRRNMLHDVAGYQQIVYGTGLATLLTEFSSYLDDRHASIARGWLLLAWMLGALFVMAGRFLMRRALHAAHRSGILVQPAIVVGSGHEGQILEWHIHRAPEQGIRVVGFVDAGSPIGAEVAGGLRVLGHIDDLPDLIRRHHLGQVLVATSDVSQVDALRALQHVLPTPSEISLAPDLFRTLTTAGHLRRIGGDALLVLDKVRITGFDAVLKNTLDVLGALVVLVLTAPICAVIALVIKITSPGPILTHRPAVGAGGRVFYALKFRTGRYPMPEMIDEAARERIRRGLPVRENPNTTAFGRFLIRLSLDELPQMLNVLRRQMSLVGPYKISPDQLALYGATQLALFTVRPGITGVCQVRGRGELTIEERSLLDAEYVRTYSIWQDVSIILASVPAVLRGTGAY